MRTILLTVLCLSAAAGCKRSIDGGKAERLIKDELFGPKGIKVKTATCPKDLVAKKGSNFTCAVTLATGEAVTVNVEQKDDEGNIYASVTGLVIEPAKIVSMIGPKLGLGAKATATCDKAIAKKDDRIQCELAEAGAAHKVEINITDPEGGFDWKELGGAPPADAPPAKAGEPTDDHPAEPTEPAEPAAK
jgi:hypothetical protein